MNVDLKTAVISFLKVHFFSLVLATYCNHIPHQETQRKKTGMNLKKQQKKV